MGAEGLKYLIFRIALYSWKWIKSLKYLVNTGYRGLGHLSKATEEKMTKLQKFFSGWSKKLPDPVILRPDNTEFEKNKA